MPARCSRIEVAAAIWRGCRGDEPSSTHVGASSIEPRLWSFSTRQYADEEVCSQKTDGTSQHVRLFLKNRLSLASPPRSHRYFSFIAYLSL